MYVVRYYETGHCRFYMEVIVQISLMPMILSLLFIYDYDINGDDNSDYDDGITLSNE